VRSRFRIRMPVAEPLFSAESREVRSAGNRPSVVSLQVSLPSTCFSGLLVVIVSLGVAGTEIRAFSNERWAAESIVSSKCHFDRESLCCCSYCLTLGSMNCRDYPNRDVVLVRLSR
jgi:hypothetical protein